VDGEGSAEKARELLRWVRIAALRRLADDLLDSFTVILASSGGGPCHKMAARRSSRSSIGCLYRWFDPSQAAAAESQPLREGMHAPACFEDSVLSDVERFRAQAAHARRLAGELTDTHARAALHAYADELELKASEIGRQQSSAIY
jgi:hypothetical protein